MTEMELLQEVLKEIKGIKEEQQKTNERLTALETDIKFTISVIGELQGNIEEIEADTQYLAMRKLIDKQRVSNNILLRRNDKE